MASRAYLIFAIMRSHIFALLKKDIQLDLRQQFGLGGILLYVLASVFIIYIVFGEVEGRHWILLYWIIVLFSAVNALLKSYVQEGHDRRIYYYTLTSSLAFIGSKLIYNLVLQLAICLLAVLVFTLMMGFPVLSLTSFAAAVLLGSLGIATNFTFISAIASQARNENTLMMILSLPVIIPLLLPVIRLSLKSLGPVTFAMIKSDLMMLVAVDLIIVALTLTLASFISTE